MLPVVEKSSKTPKASNMLCNNCSKNNHNTSDCRAFSKFKQQKKACIEPKSGPGKKSLAIISEEINALKRKLKPEKTASSKKRKAESLLSTEINLNDLTSSSDEDDNKAYILLNHLFVRKLSWKNISANKQPLSW
jgi:hypothetical protein